MKTELNKLIISCGGTGGHFFPGLSVAREFQKRGGQVRLLLSGANADSQSKIASGYGIDAVALPPMPHYRKNPFRFLSGFFGGYRQAKRHFCSFQPQAMLGMGSFATLPVVLAAVRCHVPLFVHDGNARIGKANRVFSRWAEFAGCAFPAVNSGDCRCPVRETGMPVRQELLEFVSLDKAGALAEVNREFKVDFSSDKPVILITGGSQGAAVFNQVLPEALKKLDGDFQVIHLTGKGKFEETQKLYSDAVFPRLLLESTGKMAEVMASADLVFSRSGGSTIAELALFGKAAVLVPYPYAAEGHQLDNARYFAGKEAAVLVENHEFTVDKASALMKNFLNEPEKWREMGRKMNSMARPDAAGEMIDGISSAL